MDRNCNDKYDGGKYVNTPHCFGPAAASGERARRGGGPFHHALQRQTPLVRRGSGGIRAPAAGARLSLSPSVLDVENDSALDAFSALRRALQFAAILAIDFSFFRNRTFALGRGGARGGHETLFLAFLDVSVPDSDDDGVGDDVAQVAVHHLEDEAAVEAEVVLDKSAEEATVFRRFQLVVHFQVVTDEFFHVRRIEESVDPNHEREDGDDAEAEEEEGNKGEDLVIVQVDRQNAVASVRQQVTVNLWRSVELAERSDGESFGSDELMTEDGGLDQVEAVGQDVRSKEGMHRVELNEHVGQEHYLHADVEESQIISEFGSAAATTEKTGRVLLAHLARDGQILIEL